MPRRGGSTVDLGDEGGPDGGRCLFLAASTTKPSTTVTAVLLRERTGPLMTFFNYARIAATSREIAAEAGRSPRRKCLLTGALPSLR